MKTNILFSVITILFLSFVIIYDQRSKAELLKPVTFTPGTYTAEAEGYHGQIKLDVTFDENSITSINIVEDHETEGIGHEALPMMVERIIQAQGTGVDAVTGATVSSAAIKQAVNNAAMEALVSSLAAFKHKNGKKLHVGETIEDIWDIVVVGGGGAGLFAAAQAAQDGNTVLVLEKAANLGGNTVVSGGAFQSVIPYLVWEENNPDATEGKGDDGKMYPKTKVVAGGLNTLRMLLNWSEAPFDTAYYATHPFVAGDVEEQLKHGVHSEYLPVLQALKKELRTYLAWADKQMRKGKKETELTLFSTNNLHIFQTYYGGLRPSYDGKEWCYGKVELVSQFIQEGQQLKPWMTQMGVDFYESQAYIVGMLHYRSVSAKGAQVTINGMSEFVPGNQGIYVKAPLAAIVNANSHNKVMTLTTAQDLIFEDGRVKGVNALCNDGSVLKAYAKKGVIIATGGYAANVKKVVETNRYWSADNLTDQIRTTNISTMQGDGIWMAQGIGADVTGMGWTQLLPLSFAKTGSIAFGGVDNSIFISPKTGKRYVDEVSERDALSIAAFDNGIVFRGAHGAHFFIMGKYSFNLVKAGPPLPDQEEAQYTVKIAQLPQLLKDLNIDTDAQTIVQTIREYDEMLMAGKKPTDVDKKFAIYTIGYSVRNEDGTYQRDTYDLENTELLFRILAPATHHTMGGLLVDTERRVLDTQGHPIPGLFAAGEVTGGIHGGNRLGGNAITEVLVSGRIAARNAGK